MSLKDKTKMIRYALTEFKKATHMNNGQLGALLTSPNSIRTKLATDAIAVPLKSWLNTKVKSKAGKAILAKIPASKFGTALMYADAANAGTQMLRDFLPTVAKTADWTMTIPFNVLNQTLGRIPGLGGFFRAIHNFITEGVSKVADFFGLDSLAETGKTLVLDDPSAGFETNIDWQGKGNGGNEEMPKQNTSKVKINDPKFYGNLDLHKTFTIPGAYTKKTVVNGTLATPKIVAHRVAENPMPDVSAMIDRLNQKFTLIKAVRGLSKVDYDVVDIANYERLVKIALLQYYVTKKVIQAAKTYNLIQVNVGDNIIDSLGFVPSEVRTNLANYETLLCQMHRFICNNLPSTGMWRERLEYLVSVNIPDYDDAKVATIHMFSPCMRDVFYDRNQPTKSLTFDTIPHAQNNSYSVLMANFLSIQSVLAENTLWQQLVADYFGAFGSQAIWEDKDYPSYSKPLDIRNGDKDLNREQVKNAFYINTKAEFITIDPGVSNLKIIMDTDNATPIQLPNYQFGEVYDATSAAGSTNLTYLNILSRDSYLLATTSYSTIGLDFGPNNYMLLPDKNGVGAQVITPVDQASVYFSMDNHETIYTLHKDNYSEEECLDLSQFKNRSIGGVVSMEATPNKLELLLVFKTHEYAIMDSVVYTYGSNGSQIVEQRYTICDEVISDDDLQNNESPIDFPDEIMCWALIDWMPFAHFTFYGYDSVSTKYSPRDALLIDMDSFGSLDDRAFSTSINYSIYSLQGANLRVDKNSKRVSNLGDVYKDKPSRKG